MPEADAGVNDSLGDSPTVTISQLAKLDYILQVINCQYVPVIGGVPAAAQTI